MLRAVLRSYVWLLVTCLLPCGLEAQSPIHCEVARLIGADTGPGDGFGMAVAIHGDVAVIVSALDSYDVGLNYAHVFRREGTTWTQEQRLALEYNAYAPDEVSVATDGSVIVIGAGGMGHVYRFDGSLWVLESQPVWGGVSWSDAFGASVSIDGDWIVIGAPVTGTYSTGSGAAYAFHHDGEQWLQAGMLAPSDGSDDDRFGEVSVSGSIVAVGAYGDDDLGASSGSVYVFRREGNIWTEEAKLTAPGGQAGGMFGMSVALEGDVLAVGSAYEDNIGQDSGSVHVFRHDGTSWSYETRLTPADAASGDRFGFSVAYNDGLLAVGTVHSSVYSEGPDAAYIFQYGAGGWSERAKLLSQDLEGYNGFGYSVSLNRDQVLVGAPWSTTASGIVAGARVFGIPLESSEDVDGDGVADVCDACLGFDDGDDDDGDGIPDGCDVCPGSDDLLDADADGVPDACDTCPADKPDDLDGDGVCTSDDNCPYDANPYQHDLNIDGLGDVCASSAVGGCLAEKLIANDAARGDVYGAAVAIDGDVAVIGAPTDGSNPSSDGTLYVLRRVEGEWIEEAQLTHPATSSFCRSGTQASISGNRIALGTPGKTCCPNAVYVFTYTGVEWILEAELIPSDCSYGFGTAATIDGNVLVVGDRADIDGESDAGAAYVFRNDGTGWVEEAKLLPPAAQENRYFGASIAVSGDTTVIGASGDNELGGAAGAAYVFRHVNGEWVLESKLTASDARTRDRFGSSVDISGHLVIVGAGGNEVGEAEGAAYVFRREGATWIEEARLISPNPDNSGAFGGAVRIEGNLAVIGDPNLADPDGSIPIGAAYLYRRVGETWTLVTNLSVPDLPQRTDFGGRVALSDGVVLVGAKFDDEACGYDGTCSNTGAVYAFSVEGTDCNGNGILDECDPPGTNDSDGDTVVDCIDQCPGEDDRIDNNGNGVPDCNDLLPVPAISIWGAALMVLLFCVVAKLRFGRRRVHA